MIRTVLAMVLLVGPAACGLPGGEVQVDADDTSKALEQQRTDVREAARELVTAAEGELSATTSNSTSGFRGCESAFSEQFRNFQYLAQARIDTGPGSDSALLEGLHRVLVEAGYTVEDLREEPNGGLTTLLAAKGDLSASFVHTGGPFVGLDVSGPCLEVPEDQREPWLRTKEPHPEIR